MWPSLRRTERSCNWLWRTSWRHIIPVVLAWSWSAATNPRFLSGHGFSFNQARSHRQTNETARDGIQGTGKGGCIPTGTCTFCVWTFLGFVIQSYRIFQVISLKGVTLGSIGRLGFFSRRPIWPISGQRQVATHGPIYNNVAPYTRWHGRCLTVSNADHLNWLIMTSLEFSKAAPTRTRTCVSRHTSTSNDSLQLQRNSPQILYSVYITTRNGI